jgi:hypothetical protein
LHNNVKAFYTLSPENTLVNLPEKAVKNKNYWQNTNRMLMGIKSRIPGLIIIPGILLRQNYSCGPMGIRTRDIGWYGFYPKT